MQRPPAQQEMSAIYQLIGQSICDLQFLEDALNTLLALKIDIKAPGRVEKQDALAALKKHAKGTLGSSLKSLRDHAVMDAAFVERLTKFTEERNWLVHRSLENHSEHLYTEAGHNAARRRLNAFIEEAVEIKCLIINEIALFAQSRGINTDQAALKARKSLAKLRGEA